MCLLMRVSAELYNQCDRGNHDGEKTSTTEKRLDGSLSAVLVVT